jgi:cytoskeletal protein RodZ
MENVTNPTDGKTYNVNMQQLRELALTLQVSDGLTPTEKIIDSDSWLLLCKLLVKWKRSSKSMTLLASLLILWVSKVLILARLHLANSRLQEIKTADLQEGAAEAQLEAAAQHAGPNNPQLQAQAAAQAQPRPPIGAK